MPTLADLSHDIEDGMITYPGLPGPLISLHLDRATSGERPAHSILLASGIPAVEHLRALDQLPDSGFRFFAVPPKVRDFGTFPVRAFAIVP